MVAVSLTMLDRCANGTVDRFDGVCIKEGYEGGFVHDICNGTANATLQRGAKV